MTQEEKQLLFKDLSARLFYGVKGLAYIVGEPCRTNTNIVGIINKSIVTDYESPMLDLIDLNSKDIIIKPYLRPMSSMTVMDKKELRDEDILIVINTSGEVETTINGFDWLNKKQFDYRGLIPMGLALEAPEDMYTIHKTTCNNCKNNQYCSQSEYVKKNCYKL